METWEWICCHPCLTWGRASQASISSCCDGGFAVPGKTERKNKKEGLSGTARSLLSCARSQKCHRVIEWSSAGSCESEKGDSPPSVGGGSESGLFHVRAGFVQQPEIISFFSSFWTLSKKNPCGRRRPWGRQRWKFICRCDQMWLPLPPSLAASRGDKGKALSQDSKCRSECISKEVNSCYLPITWRHRTADGRPFYIGGPSLSHQYLVTTNPAASSDSFLSFAALSRPASQPLCLFWRGHQRTTMYLWGPTCPWPSSSAAAVCVCVCLSACAYE